MSVSTGEIKRRIRSIGSTRKITKAMELVSSVKMRKATQAVLSSRPYTNAAWEMLVNVAKRTDASKHPLLRKTSPVANVAVIVVSSNRGFVGSLNSQLLSAVDGYLRALPGQVVTPSVMLLGTKGRSLHTQFHHDVAAEFVKDDVVTDSIHVRPVAKMAIDGFVAGKYDQVVVAYVDYVSSLVQKPRVRQILPLTPIDLQENHLGLFDRGEREQVLAEEAAEERTFEYAFEPNADTVLETLLPRLVEMQIFRAVLETNASEHAARMLAMRNASDAAEELIDDLTLTFNQARQAAITQDLAEISASRAALEG